MYAAKFPCQFCADWRVWPGFNDLKTKRPDLVLEWDFSKNIIKPEEVIFKSNKMIWWICKKGHSWNDSINHRNGPRSCPYCSYHRIIPGETDLESQFPEIAKEWDYKKNFFKPSSVSQYSNKMIWWVCGKCNYEWKASIANRTQGRNCKKCSYGGPSKLEKNFAQDLKENFSQKMVFNSRKIIAPLELDIFFPVRGLGLEICGEFWHSEFVNPEALKKHETKTNLCLEKNVKLMVIWEAYLMFERESVLKDLKKILEDPNLEIPEKYTYDHRRLNPKHSNEILKEYRAKYPKA